MNHKKKVLVVGGLAESLTKFRGELLREMVARGCEVVAMSAAADAQTIQEIEGLGVRFVPYRLFRSGLSARQDAATVKDLVAIFRREKPDVVFAYTIKPVIWSAAALRLSGTTRAHFIALITGLGYAFAGTTWKRKALTRLVTSLYRGALTRAATVIFQNRDNQRAFVERTIVPVAKTLVVNGSGVDLTHYEVMPLPDRQGPLRFLLIARLLKEKGIREYAAAADILRQMGIAADCVLVGPLDPSPDAISQAEVDAWTVKGTLRYLGATKDVRPFLRDCHVYVLPSYHEGMPRTVLEAMACGRPIITTDATGCRDTVEENVNGFKVPVADARALAEAMQRCMHTDLESFALGSRKMAVERFDVRAVNQTMLQAMRIAPSARSR